MSDVLIYNAGGSELLHAVDLNHAIGMLVRKVAKVREVVTGQKYGTYPMPRSLELVRWIYTKWVWESDATPPVSRNGILRRDNWTCAYCGRTGTTFDHILPRHLGGRTTWLNCVAACEGCNNRRKGGKTLAQAAMVLQIVPYVPTSADLRARRR